MKYKTSLVYHPVTLSKSNLNSAVLALLQQFKAIPPGVDIDHIEDISFGDTSKGLVKINLMVKEVDTIIFDG